jgi:hypothetical protein
VLSFTTAVKLRVKHAATPHAREKLVGHIVSFASDGPLVLGQTLPDEKLFQRLSVTFIGQRAKWDAAQLREQVTDWASVDVRKVRQWLEFLKANNALYHDVVIADNTHQLWTDLAGLPEKLCNEAAVLDDAVYEGMAEAAGQSLNAAVASTDAASAAQPGLAPADPQAPPPPPPPQPPPPTPPPQPPAVELQTQQPQPPAEPPLDQPTGEEQLSLPEAAPEAETPEVEHLMVIIPSVNGQEETKHCGP